MTRIVAGTASGRRLVVPRGQRTRPTSQRVREAMFNTLVARWGDLDGCRVLDLYAGTGTLGLEALSRGAAHALLVEHNRRTARLAAANAATLALAGVAVRADRVERVLGARPRGPAYDVVLLDPPYDTPTAAVTAVLADVVRHGWAARGAVVVVERPTRAGSLVWPAGLVEELSRRYGETTLWYGRAQPQRPAGAAGEGSEETA